MRPATEGQQRYLYREGMPVDVIGRLSAQAAYLLSQDLNQTSEEPLGCTHDQCDLIDRLLTIGFDPEIVFKMGIKTGKSIVDCLDYNVGRCPCCSQFKIRE